MMDMRIGSRATASPEVRVEARSWGKQPRACARAEGGQALLEFVLVMPILLTVMFGIIVFGIALHNYMELTSATSSGAQLLSISRGQTTDPCNTTVQAVNVAAPSLTQTNLTFAFVLNGTSYNAKTCSGAQSNLVAGQNAQVTVTYPCNIKFFGFNPSKSCTLTSQMQARVK